MAMVRTPINTESCHGSRDARTRDREGEALFQVMRAPIAVVFALAAACAPPAARDASGSYDLFTGRLIQLQADQNGDGRADQWSYLDGTRVIRGEADTDGDGRVDRWEYFDDRSQLVRVGTSSANDGIEDTWTWTSAANEEGRVDHARGRDRHLDLHEYYRGELLIRTEEDTNHDGRIDRWDRYEGPVRRQVEFDTTLTAGRPNRRVLFDAQGRFVRVEGDPELDGTFVTVSDAVPDDIRKGQQR